MIDYDMCVVVYRTRTGFVVTDDRECNKRITEAVSLPDYLNKTTKKIRALLKASRTGEDGAQEYNDDEQEESEESSDDDNDYDDDGQAIPVRSASKKTKNKKRRRRL